jgi:hypothetical protein
MIQKKLYIKNIVTSVLLVLFAFSTTPRNILHDLFANHKDEVSLSKKTSSSQVKTFDYLCKVENTVVESPFIESSSHFDFSTFPQVTQHSIFTSYFFTSSKYFFFEHRGPPAIA